MELQPTAVLGRVVEPQPTAVLGRVVELQPFYDAPGLGGGEALGEALLEGSGAVGVEIVQDHPDRLDLRVGLVH